MDERHSDYTTSFSVTQSPEAVFDAITDVRAWWIGDIDGDTRTLDASFTYRYEDIHRSTQHITELVPGKRIAWHITDAHLSFTRDPEEWRDTHVVFDIERTGDATTVTFTHAGLVPAFECFTDCSNAWGHYINGSLRRFITTGQATSG